MTRWPYPMLYAGLLRALLVVATTGFDLLAFRDEPSYTPVRAIEAYLLGLGVTLITVYFYLRRDLSRLVETVLEERC